MKVKQDHEIGNGVPETVTCLDEFYYNMRFINERDKVLDLVTATPTRKNMYRYINLWNQHGVDGLDKEHALMWGYERPNGGSRGWFYWWALPSRLGVGGVPHSCPQRFGLVCWD